MSWTFTKLLLLSAALINYHHMSTATGNFLQSYLSHTPQVDWQGLSVMVAADMINERAKRKRKPTREILKQRRRFGEYFTLVREMRLEDGRYFFEYFRMSVKRYTSKDTINRSDATRSPRSTTNGRTAEKQLNMYDSNDEE